MHIISVNGVRVLRQSVNNKQIVFVLFITIVTGAIINVPKTQAISAGHGAWLPMLLIGIIYGFGAMLIIYLNKTYEGDTLFEYSGKIIGRFGAYLLAIIYTIFYVLVSSYYCITFFEMVKANFLPKTPEWLLILFSMPFLGFLAYKGFTNNARLAELVGIVFLAVSLVLFATMFFEGRITNILPLYIKSETGRYFLAMKDTINQYAGITLLTLIPISKSNKNVSKTVFWTFVGLAVFYILDVYGCYAMIGIDEIQHYNYPLVDAIRLVQYKRIEFFQRVDIAYMTIGFMRVFVAEGIVYMLAVEYVCRMLPKVKRLTIVVAAGLVFYAFDLAAIGIPKAARFLDVARTLYSIFVTFIIPGGLLMVLKVKKNAKKSD
jgi:spore germination protein